MSTTRKIEGWISEWWRRYADTEGKYEFHHLHPPVANCTHCTLIIGGKGYTEAEVLAYTNDLFRAHFDPGHFVERFREERVGGEPYEQTMSQWISSAKAIVDKNHGIKPL